MIPAAGDRTAGPGFSAAVAAPAGCPLPAPWVSPASTATARATARTHCWCPAERSAREQPHQSVQVTDERRVQVHLHAEVFDHRDAAGVRNALGRPAQQRFVDAADVRVVRHRRFAAAPRPPVRKPMVCSSIQVRATRPSCTMMAASAARHHASVPGRTARWMSAIAAVSLRRGSMTISVRAGSFWISRRITRVRAKPCDCQGFLPTKTATSQCSKSPWMPEPVILPCTQASPVFSCASALDRYWMPERLDRAVGVDAAEVIALAAAAVIQDALAAVPGLDGRELRGDLADRRVPVDGFVRAVRPAGASGCPGGRRRSGSSPCVAISRRHSPATRDAPCRRGCGRCDARPSAPRGRSSERR